MTAAPAPAKWDKDVTMHTIQFMKTMHAGDLVKLPEAPETIADGLRGMYLQHCVDIYAVFRVSNANSYVIPTHKPAVSCKHKALIMIDWFSHVPCVL